MNKKVCLDCLQGWGGLCEGGGLGRGLTRPRGRKIRGVSPVRGGSMTSYPASWETTTSQGMERSVSMSNAICTWADGFVHMMLGALAQSRALWESRNHHLFYRLVYWVSDVGKRGLA